MRIIHTYSLGTLKCTLMIYQSRYTLKIEDEYGAIDYKLKEVDELDIAQLEGLTRSKHCLSAIHQAFIALREGRDPLLAALKEDPEDSPFDHII